LINSALQSRVNGQRARWIRLRRRWANLTFSHHPCTPDAAHPRRARARTQPLVVLFDAFVIRAYNHCGRWCLVRRCAEIGDHPDVRPRRMQANRGACRRQPRSVTELQWAPSTVQQSPPCTCHHHHSSEEVQNGVCGAGGCRQHPSSPTFPRSSLVSLFLPPLSPHALPCASNGCTVRAHQWCIQSRSKICSLASSHACRRRCSFEAWSGTADGVCILATVARSEDVVAGLVLNVPTSTVPLVIRERRRNCARSLRMAVPPGLMHAAPRHQCMSSISLIPLPLSADALLSASNHVVGCTQGRRT
jgi:hypothetical protein